MTDHNNLTKRREVQVISPSESTPLQEETPSRQNSVSKMDALDAETKRVLIKIVLDVILLCCVGFPVLMFFLFGVPYERGFFCNDESLMHPFHDSTVTHTVLYTVGFGIPIVSMVLTEFMRWKLNMEADRELKLFGRNIPVWVQNVYKFIGILAFGAACSQLTTDIAKYTIGRLRPHFINVCQPVFPDGTNCSSATNFYRYMEDFTCTNDDSTKRKLKEMRLSFPSGHSSFSMYTMTFAALYLHCRMDWKGSKLAKHFLQFVFISLAWFTALSRISNYKHHWSDVLAGSLQGLVVALLIVFGVSDLFKNRYNARKTQVGSRYELNSSPNTRTIN